MSMVHINRDDEINLSAYERGHRYGPTDIIVGVFELDGERSKHTVRFDGSPGGGCAYYEANGYPLEPMSELVLWRYATEEEIEVFESDVERLANAVERERAETLTVLLPARRRIGRTG